MFGILKSIFGTSNSRRLKSIQPLVKKINEFEAQYQSLSDDELRAKTVEFRNRLQAGETTDDILCEAFAAVKNACRRICGHEVEVTGHKLVWNMIPYDTQLIGGIVLHQCGIAEMATGEGKTLVATLPLYLNALTGKNCQLVTVNDYLALRDSTWMGYLLQFLGLTVGCIQNSMHPSERREQYNCDVTYGTNSEFGFDYLRDMGMAQTKEYMVQRDHYFAIVDEVDSVLIDEARTPLIIAGPSPFANNHFYDELKPQVAKLVKLQNSLCTTLINDAKAILDKAEISDEEKGKAFEKLVKAKIGLPTHKQLMRLMEDPAIRRGLDAKESEIHSDSNRGWIQQVKNSLYFSINEKNNDAELGEVGRREICPEDTEAFVIPDLPGQLSEVEASTLPPDEKKDKVKEIQDNYEQQSMRLHNLSQLLKAYCLFEKDRHYIVQENKVVIVDEFTGRPMPGRRWSEGLHQAVEAKEGVEIEQETQTFASITIQNYFRLYSKLAGMTGTAETEAAEFKQIYKLDVVTIPTNRPCIRIDSNDRIFKTKREKNNAIIAEIKECYERGQPVLVGTVSVEASEILSRQLSIQKVPHNVLNAKHNASEAEIVAGAGQKGAITIATNMAGRGTDIKLGEGVAEIGGLRVVGSERHDSRRIDRQLRGRCSRQGDPGSSLFYVSLEDNLMRLFGGDRIAGMMEKMGMEEGEELSHPALNFSVGNAQKRVEQQHFAMRKRTLEYDDVMNRQRSVVYELRKDILFADNMRDKLFDFVFTRIIDQVEEVFAIVNAKGDKPDYSELKQWLMHFPVKFEDEDFEGELPQDVSNKLVDRIESAYKTRENTQEEYYLRRNEQRIMLEAIDRRWQEHLYAMDGLRQAVQLRAYGQKDPLVEYKKEAFSMFSTLVADIQNYVCQNMFVEAHEEEYDDDDSINLDFGDDELSSMKLEEFLAELRRRVKEEEAKPLTEDERNMNNLDLLFGGSDKK